MTTSLSPIKKRILSENELEKIHSASLTRRGDGSIVSPDCAYGDMLITLWGVLLDDPEWNKKTDGPPIIPSMYQIPDRQWKLIAKWIGDIGTDSHLSFMLQFVNIGPSAYVEADE